MPLAPKPSYRRRTIAIAVSIVFGGLAVVLGSYYFSRIYTRPLSEDAVLTANVARMAASVPGRVEMLAVRENSLVKKGDLLFRIDPAFYMLQLEQARANLKVAEAALDARERGIAAEGANAMIAAEQIQRAQVNLAHATQTLQRLQGLLPKGYVTAQQVDDAQALKRNAETSLKEAFAQRDAADSLVGTNAGATALVTQSRVQVAIAERQLRETEVYAPNDGRVVGLAIALGDYLLPAQSAFSLIDTTKWYASAAFLETELSLIPLGACARVYVAADRTKALAGMVESIGWGVASEDVIPIPRSLPYVPKTLNWVRVGQRFPVRIQLKGPPQDLMRAGGSATVIVHADEKC